MQLASLFGNSNTTPQTTALRRGTASKRLAVATLSLEEEEIPPPNHTQHTGCEETNIFEHKRKMVFAPSLKEFLSSGGTHRRAKYRRKRRPTKTRATISTSTNNAIAPSTSPTSLYVWQDFFLGKNDVITPKQKSRCPHGNPGLNYNHPTKRTARFNVLAQQMPMTSNANICTTDRTSYTTSL